MSIDWKTLSLAIPLIVLAVTMIYNLGKEKRDRNYQFRPIPSIHGVTTHIRESNDPSGYFVLYNEQVIDVDGVEEGSFLEVKNIATFPMLNVLIDVNYEGNVNSQKYQIMSIQEGQSFLIPISGVQQVNGATIPSAKTKMTIITYRSLSGQKYKVQHLPSGKIIIKAKNGLFYNQKIISTENNRNSTFRKL